MALTQHHEPDYVLGHSEVEIVRLIQQAQLCHDSTRRLFQDAGIVPGMRVLDVGSGPGDVALLLATMVGPHGEVVGIERNRESLRLARQRVRFAGHGNVQFIEADIEEGISDGTFDAVAGRFVLMYVQDPVATLRSFVRSLRPGGIVAFQEYDFTLPPIAYPPSPLQVRMIEWQLRAFAVAGVERSMGFKLPSVMRAAGLERPQLRLEALTGIQASSTIFGMAASLVRSLLPTLVSHGIATEEEVGIDTLEQRLRDEVIRNDGVLMRPIHANAWGRRLPYDDRARLGMMPV